MVRAAADLSLGMFGSEEGALQMGAPASLLCVSTSLWFPDMGRINSSDDKVG